ncbi:FecR family protein [Chitinophaga sp. LS1]|uniref:FecR family protein n=1 Tax=Chitinophaga sp. LS1 TaxID=3051176 RepID=UPI002AAB7299|nr:FecR domain-containing protein [Chitinophaga sp. LS1]WPV65765.1 FecR domain-containing protein [Chitinophaga sp. LS1]
MKELLEKFLSDSMTKEEQEEFRALLAREDLREEWAAYIEKILAEKRYDDAPVADRNAIFQQMMSKSPVYPYPISTLHRYGWWAAAAVLLLLLGAGTLWLQKPVPPPANLVVADVAPGTTKAVLTLANGQTVPLDSAGVGSWMQGNTSVHQSGGLLAYSGAATYNAISYNTLTTPRGGTFRVTLPDGSNVWLNAASSLRYPTSFKSSSERLVEVQGEAYFEIAQNAQQPFKVKVNDQTTIVVLGTSFNINAYANEGGIATTLFTGAVRMNHGNEQATLHPGQQARTGLTTIETIQNVDTAQVLAWKNGLFDFHNATLPEVMRQLTRWYDIDVVYEGNIPAITFDGKMDRHLQLSQIIKIFSYMKLNCRLEGNKRLVVLP